MIKHSLLALACFIFQEAFALGQTKLIAEYFVPSDRECSPHETVLYVGGSYDLILTLLPGGKERSEIEYTGITDWKRPQGISFEVNAIHTPWVPFDGSPRLLEAMHVEYFVGGHEITEDSLWRAHGQKREMRPPVYHFSFDIPSDAADSYLCVAVKWDHPQYGHLVAQPICIRVMKPCSENAELLMWKSRISMAVQKRDHANFDALVEEGKTFRSQFLVEGPDAHLRLTFDGFWSTCRSSTINTAKTIAGSLVNLRIQIESNQADQNMVKPRNAPRSKPRNLTVEIGRIAEGKYYPDTDTLQSALKMRYFLSESQRILNYTLQHQKPGTPGSSYITPEFNFQIQIPESLAGQILRFTVRLVDEEFGLLEASQNLEIFLPCSAEDTERIRTSYVSMLDQSRDYERAIGLADSFLALGWRSVDGLMAASHAAKELKLHNTAIRYADLCYQTFGRTQNYYYAEDAALALQDYEKWRSYLGADRSIEGGVELSRPPSFPESSERSQAAFAIWDKNRIERFDWKRRDYLTVALGGWFRPESCAETQLDTVYAFLQDYRAIFGLHDPRSEIVLQPQFDRNSKVANSVHGLYDRIVSGYSFEQVYNGVPVFNGLLKVGFWPSGSAMSALSAAIIPDLDLNTVPTVGAEEAYQIVSARWLSRPPAYHCTAKAPTLYIKPISGSPRLVWLFDVNCEKTPGSRWTEQTWVDAQTGESPQWFEPVIEIE